MESALESLWQTAKDAGAGAVAFGVAYSFERLSGIEGTIFGYDWKEMFSVCAASIAHGFNGCEDRYGSSLSYAERVLGISLYWAYVLLRPGGFRSIYEDVVFALLGVYYLFDSSSRFFRNRF